MDFRYTPHEQQFRLEVRRFIAEHCPCELKGFHEIHAEHVPLEMAFLKRMAAKGWLGAAFPQEYGGLGGERAPMAEYIDALPEGVEPVEVDTFPGFAGKVSVVVFEKKPKD